jgi:acyl-CoA reductase-like NAD-dependent aldehyde dehydrogenase
MRVYGPFIKGEWVRGARDGEVRNPYDASPVASISWGGPDQVEQAIQATVEAARRAALVPAYERQTILARASEAVTDRADELAQVLAKEAGKPIKHARGEVARAAVTFSLAAAESRRVVGETLPLDVSPNGQRRLGITKRFPLGPIAGICPFNFPLNLVAHKVAPAFACGNAIVVKPASATPLSALMLAEILRDAGAPAGTFNVVPCSAKDASPLVEDDRLKMITFTGSAEVGWDIKARARHKRVCLELGGNAAMVVEPDTDIDRAVDRAVVGGYAYAGQVCISVQRILLHERIYDSFVERFCQRVSSLRTGDPLSEETDVGPVIDEASAARIEEWITEARDAGGKVLVGGNRKSQLVEPTVLAEVPKECRVVCEEAFAPLTVLAVYRDFEDALRSVNDSRFGLQAGVFTSSLSKALHAFEILEVGGVIINDFPTFRVDSMPYGGVKESGFGREGVAYAIEEMTEPRLLVLEYPPPPDVVR